MVLVARSGMAPLLLVLGLTGLAATACVPEPANRATPPPDAEATAEVTPTPAGPTPTPSFVRPTPTPEPSFVVYIVKTGDTLDRIARRYHTSVRSLAYWNRIAYPSLDPDSANYKPNDIKVGWQLQLHPNTEVDPENLPPASETPEEPTAAPSAQF
jgi:LysM repeat protein